MTGRRTRQGLDKVFVALSSLDFDDARAALADRTKKSSFQRAQLASKPLSERRRPRVEMASSERLLRLADGSGRRAKGCLVAGNGGAGKTLLMYKLLAGWEEGSDEELQSFEFVFYVSGRDEEALRNKTALGLLGLDRFKLTFAEEKQMEDYLKANSSKVLVILDGGDEIADDWDKCKGLQDLLEKESLPGCTFIFTSRPCSQVYDVVPWCEAHFYLVGFSDERLTQLLIRRLGEEEGEQLAAHLQLPERLQLWELMKETPLLANMVAQLVEERQSLPQTTTEIYTAMMKNTVRRYATKDGVVELEGLSQPESDWPEAVRQPLHELSELALAGLLKGQFVFDMKDAKKKCRASTLRTGLVEEVETESVEYGYRHQVQFGHSTWQEFFAARAVTYQAHSQLDGMLDRCVQSIGVGEECQSFWRFLCGLIDVRHLPTVLRSLSAMCERSGQSSTSRSWTLFMLSCLAEVDHRQGGAAQEDASRTEYLEQASKVVLLSPTLDLNGHHITLTEMTNISVCLQHAKHVKGLNFVNCHLTADMLGVLASRPHHAKWVILSENKLHGRSLQLFAQSCQPQLEQLTLCNCGLDDTDIPSLHQLVLRCCTLLCLRLDRNHLSFTPSTSTAKNFIEAIAASRLEVLHLRRNPIFSHEAGDVLSKIIAGNSCLRELYLDGTGASTHNVCGLLAELHSSTNLQSLSLQNNPIDDNVIEPLADSLRRRHQVAVQCIVSSSHRPPPAELIIRLQKTCISVPAALCLASLMPRTCSDKVVVSSRAVVTQGKVFQRDLRQTIKRHQATKSGSTLFLSGAELDDEDAAELAAALEDDECELTSLFLLNNHIGNTGLAALAGALQRNTSLQALVVSFNDFGETGLGAMAKNLARYNSTLRWLDLGHSRVLSARSSYSRGEDIITLVGCCKGLQLLNLHSSGLGRREGQLIGEALAMPTCRLIVLLLGRNQLSDEGATALCVGLQVNRSLKHLSLSRINIHDNGAASITDCVHRRVESGAPLQQVWMGNNPVSEDVFTGCIAHGNFIGDEEVMNAIALYLDS